ncbi:MAG: DNA polymerase III subunit epsilon [Legionellales bacterium]|nr:DNA polymerase III subunit epsilon [Legionellales bacterium]
MRQICLDTESTGLKHEEGHRLTEIGCVELVDRKITGNEFQCYINPMRPLDKASIEITGLTNEFLDDKPLFADIMDDFINFLGDGDEIIIHNAAFDVEFLKAEFARANRSFEELVLSKFNVVDTLKIAREKFPGQKNSLDALCSRFDIDSFDREKHGALLDSQILVEVYLILTGGQSVLFDESINNTLSNTASTSTGYKKPKIVGEILNISEEDNDAHKEYLAFMEESNKMKALWESLE